MRSVYGDIGIAGRTGSEFIENLEAVFQKIHAAGLKLSRGKSQFGVQGNEFLGRTITPKGISPINAKIERFIDGLRLPTNVKQTQRFIGFIYLYKEFFPELSDQLLPFYKLLKNDTAFLITSDHEEAFSSLMEHLKRACNTSLRLPLPDKQFVIITDASEHAAGYALMIDDYTKEDQGEKKRMSYAPVMFGSKTFNPAQMKSSAYVNQFLGVYFAFTAIRHIICGNKQPIFVLTDNKSLTRFFQTKHLTHSPWNHIDFILQFNFIIRHISGRTNKASDYLSRTFTDPQNQIELTINERLQVYDIVIDGIAADLPLTDADPIHFDNVHNKMIQALLSQVQNTSVPCLRLPSTIRNLPALLEADHYSVTCAYQLHDGVLPLNHFFSDPKED